MVNWKPAVATMKEGLDQIRGGLSKSEGAGLLEDLSALLDDLTHIVKQDYYGDAYALEKIGKARWGFAAALGIGEDNGLDFDHLTGFTRSAITTLENTLNRLDRDRRDRMN